MRKILTSLMLIASAYSFAQVGISAQNTDTPQATLDVSSIDGKTNGILIPRVSRAVADDMAKPPKKTEAGKASAIVESTLIYIDDISGATPTKYATQVTSKGFYYFKNNKWVSLSSGSAGSGALIQAYESATATLEDDVDFVIFTPTTGDSTLSMPGVTVDGRKVCVFNNSNDGNLTTSPQARGQNSVIAPNAGSCYVSYKEVWYGVGYY